METKQNVKQRRLEKLRRLQELEGKNTPLRSSELAVRDERRPPVPGIPEAGARQPAGAEDNRWSDPEYVWKHRSAAGPASFRSGYGPHADDSGIRLKPPTPKQLWVRLLLCCALFAGIWGMFRLPYPWAQTGKRLVTEALTEPMNMDAVAAWYESKFHGTPSILPSFRRSGEESLKASSGGSRTFFAPAKGEIAAPFAAGKQGIMVKTQEDAPVYAMDTGLVTFAGMRDESGFTVEIQHPNNLKTTYGYVEECKLEVNDWIKGGEAIGKAGKQPDGGELYFAVQKEGRYVNPADVVSIVK